MIFARKHRFILAFIIALAFVLTIFYLFVSPITRPVRAENSLAIVSAASYLGAPLAAEQIVVAFGSNLATGTVVAPTLPLPTVLNGVSVKVRDAAGAERLAPLFFISPTQINFQIPPGTANGVATATVVNNDINAASGSFQISAVAPSLFSADASGKGLAAANVLRITAGGSQTYEQIGRFDAQQSKFIPLPIDLGPPSDQVFLILYGTGIRNRSGLSAVQAKIGSINAEVQFAGAQGVFSGLDQINVRIPRDVPASQPATEFDVAISVDGKAANPVRVSIKPPPSETIFLAMLRAEGSAMSPASGASLARLAADEKSAVIKFNYANLTTPETSAHIHGPADPGQDGAILFDLDTAPKQPDGSSLWTFTNVGVTTVAQIVQALKSGRLYINIHSARYPNGEIRGHFGLINGSQTFTPPPPPPPLPGGAMTARDAARFLTQATFGPKLPEVTALQASSFDAWLNDQFAKPISTHLAYLDTSIAGKSGYFQQEMMESFWQKAVTGEDQLRQRIAFALSEILVVSFEHTSLNSEEFSIGAYMDTLQKNAFGNFRQLIEDVTLSPTMGRYLDMLQNDKEDPATGHIPNENYARELLQLFTIGLYKLHPDGSLMLDSNGLPIPTYNQDVIKSFAKVFTGWSFGILPTTDYDWNYPQVYRIPGGSYWRVPMQAYPGHHSTASKQLLDGVTLPANQTAQKDLKDALDNIFNHPNVGPFISRQLIQRLVTSNPSPGYIYRVTQKFNNNGQGVRGDLKAVIRAILTDYEARSLDAINNQGYGKMREPVIRFAHLLRAFNYSCSCGTFPIESLENPSYGLAQDPLHSPTVFNFFEPGYSHPGHIASAGLVSPEFQITNDTSVVGAANFFYPIVLEGFQGEPSKPIIPNYSSFTSLASTVPLLIDRLDLLMTAGGMSNTLKTSLVAEISKLPSNDPQKRVTTSIQLILTSMDYVIQK